MHQKENLKIALIIHTMMQSIRCIIFGKPGPKAPTCPESAGNQLVPGNGFKETWSPPAEQALLSCLVMNKRPTIAYAMG